MIKKRFFSSSKGRIAVALLSASIAAGGCAGIAGTGVLSPLMAYAEDAAANDQSNGTENNGADTISNGSGDESGTDQSGDAASKDGDQSGDAVANDGNQSGDAAANDGDQSDNAASNGDQSSDDASNNADQNGGDAAQTEDNAGNNTDQSGDNAGNESSNETNETGDQGYDGESIDDQDIKDNHIYELEVGVVDANGNAIEGVSVDVDYNAYLGYGNTERKKESVSGSKTITVVGDCNLSNLKVPAGYSVPKYDGTNEELFNSAPLVVGLNATTWKMEVTGKYGKDKLSSVSIEPNYNSFGGGGPETYILTITLAKEEGIFYYNSIGGNKAGEADNGYDAVYTVGSGEEVTLIFKRTVHDEETFSHFAWLEYGGPKEGKEYDPRLNIDYYITPGSVKVALTSKYLDSLGVGEHIFYAHFDDDIETTKRSVMAKIKIVDSSEPILNPGNQDQWSPSQSSTQTSVVKASGVTIAAATGDRSSNTVFVAVGCVSSVAIAGFVINRKRRKDR